MKLNLCLLILGFFYFSVVSNTKAQSPDCLWAKAIEGTLEEWSWSSDLDLAGNAYIAGFFEGIIDVDPDSGIYNLASFGDKDVFICKFDTSGKLVWGKSFGGINDDYMYTVSVDDSGYIYISGSFQETVDFNPNVDTFNLSSNGGSDIFISKFDNSGNFIWTKQIGGINYDFGVSLDVDNYGNVYTLGEFSDTVDFDPDSIGVYNLKTLSSFNDVFVLKLNSTGQFLWAKQILGGINIERARAIAIDPFGSIYTIGNFNGTVDFDPDSLQNFYLSSTGSWDIFISKLDNSGNLIWAKVMGGATDDTGNDIAFDAMGNIFTTGQFGSTVDFNPNNAIYNLTAAPGTYDAYISKLDSSGNFVWAKAIAGPDDENGYSIATDLAGNVYTSGSFYLTSDFDPSSSVFNLTSNGREEIFILKLDNSGNFVWAKSIIGSKNESAKSINLDVSGNVFLTGVFSSDTLTFGSIPIINSSSSPNGLFIAKLSNMVNGIDNVKIENNINIFPNPSTSQVTIDLGDYYQKIEIEISDITGKLLFSKSSSGVQHVQVVTNNFLSGAYIIHIKSVDFIISKKIIVVN